MGDTTRRATLIISAKDDASQQIGENSLKFTELNSAVELAKKGVELFKQAYDFAEQGAAIQRIGEQWQATADQFGINAEAAVKAMDKATNGTVDDEELMKVATRALTQETVANAQQLTDFFSIARAMTVRFGGDVVANTEAINMAIETGMSRQLKARGIIVNFTEAYKTYADQLGVTVTSLDDETKKTIRRNEVLAQGDVLVKKVGDTGVDAATKYEQFNRNLTEVGDTLKVLASDVLAPVINDFNTLLKIINGSATPLETLNYNLSFMKTVFGNNSYQAQQAQIVLDVYNRTAQIAKDSQDAFNVKVAAGTAYLQSGYIPATQSAAQANDGLKQSNDALNQSMMSVVVSTKNVTTAELYQASIKDLPLDAQLQLARSLGLVDENNYKVMHSLQLSQEEYKKTGDMQAYTKTVYELNNQLDAIKTDIKIRISLSSPDVPDIVNVGDPAGGGGAGQQGIKPKPKKDIPKPKGGGGGIQAADGVDFVVPPGYPGDSYPMRVQSGEHVRVTPAGHASGGTTNNITINDPITSVIWYAKIYGDQRAALDSLM